MARAMRPGPVAAVPKVEAPPGRIRRDLPIHYYAQLARILERDIAESRWIPGDALPSEADLCRQHGVSRTAVRQALGQLASHGLVRKEKGRRTIVLRSRVTSLVVQELRGFYDEVSERGGVVDTTILRQEVVSAPPHIAEELDVASSSDLVVLERLRAVDGDTVVRVCTHLPAPRFAPLAEMDLSRASLYAVLAAEFGVRPISGTRVIEAAVADRMLAKQLRVAFGSPTLRLTAINRDQDGTPFERFEAWYRGDETRFELVVGT